MISNKNSYQHSVMFRATNTISSGIYKISNNIYTYFNLKSVNNDLALENTELKNQVVALQNQLAQQDSSYIQSSNDYTYISAHVINNSTNRPNNYMTIDKGIRDGLAVDMGVVGSNGLVGIISAVSNKFAIIETILNNKSSINARILNSGEVGQLKWDEVSYEYAILTDIPRHVNINIGDTIVTSGYSSIFPKGIVIGTIKESELTDADATYKIKVKLSTNFKNIEYVEVIRNNNADEKAKLEQQTEK